jgi:beta-N-acetylhexosaminidase
MDDLTASMTLDEQIGQLFVVGFPALEPTPELLDLIQRERVGGVILFSRSNCRHSGRGSRLEPHAS